MGGGGDCDDVSPTSVVCDCARVSERNTCELEREGPVIEMRRTFRFVSPALKEPRCQMRSDKEDLRSEKKT